MALKVRIITPDQTVLDDSVEEIILPSSTGQVGILSGHAPLLTALESGVLRVRSDKSNNWDNVAITEGFAEVEENEVKVLVNAATRGADIDLEEARKLFNSAQSALDLITASDDRKAAIAARQDFKRTRARFMAAGGTV